MRILELRHRATMHSRTIKTSDRYDIARLPCDITAFFYVSQYRASKRNEFSEQFSAVLSFPRSRCINVWRATHPI